MRINKSGKKFESCPEFDGRAVCVDVTPLKEYQTQYGLQQKFKVVFEVDLPREDGTPYAVWSKPFTPSSHEKSAFNQFLRDWFGRGLTDAEWESFDTENLLGRPARLIVINETQGDDTYANIKLVGPHKNGEPLKPSGKFVRQIDRDAKGQYKPAEAHEPAAEVSADDWLKTKVHVGRNKGYELRELSHDGVMALVEHWMPTQIEAIKQKVAKADDRRLYDALSKYCAMKAAEQAEKAAVLATDDVPY